jgi:hypothetical protein
VGVGTLAPAAKVDILSTDTAQVRLSHSATNYVELRAKSDQVLQIISPNQSTNGAILIGKSLPGFVLGGVGFSTGDRTQFYGGSGLRFLVGAGREVGFYTENTERMRVNPGGNVGVGLHNPISKFHVQGSDAAVVVNRVQGAAGQTANLAEWRIAGGVLIAAITPTGKIKASSINFTGLPTSVAGLEQGDVWNDNGTLKIV